MDLKPYYQRSNYAMINPEAILKPTMSEVYIHVPPHANHVGPSFTRSIDAGDMLGCTLFSLLPAMSPCAIASVYIRLSRKGQTESYFLRWEFPVSSDMIQTIHSLLSCVYLLWRRPSSNGFHARAWNGALAKLLCPKPQATTKMLNNVLLSFLIANGLFTATGGLLVAFVFIEKAHMNEAATTSNVATNLLLQRAPLTGSPSLLHTSSSTNSY